MLINLTIIKIKKFLSKKKRIVYLKKIIYGFFSNSFVDFIITNGISNQSYIVNVLGADEADKVIFYFDYTKNISGFFSIFIDIISQLHYVNINNLTPLIFIGEKTFYFDTKYSEIVQTNNVFDYFFSLNNHVSFKSTQELGFNKLVYSSGHSKTIFYKKFGFSDSQVGNIYYLAKNNDALNHLAFLYKKYISLKQEILDIIEMKQDELKLGSDFISVHFRGSDFRMNILQHPNFITEADYFEEIDKILLISPKSMIFLATDDQLSLESFIIKYGNQLRWYEDNHRSKSNIATLYDHNPREFHKFNLGLELLMDVVTLSKGGYFIGGLSNVSTFSRVLNRSGTNRFIEEVILGDKLNLVGTKQ